VPVVLDTDHLSILLQESQPECDRLRARLRALPLDDVATTIICFQEQVQGWLAFATRAKTDSQILLAYSRLDSMWRWFCRMNVLPFGDAALSEFHSLRPKTRRLGTLDLRIASISIATDSTLLSRNLRDFRQVPGLRVEDWTR
jgi:tRNA(fMet)-specific endonuclease VapC